MKILSSILLSLIIIISTSGIFVSEHYCSNQLISVSFFSNSKKCCDDSCPFCKNVNHSYKVKTKVVQTESHNLSFTDSFTSFLLPLYSNIFITNFDYNTSIVRIFPPPNKNNLNIYFSNFRL